MFAPNSVHRGQVTEAGSALRMLACIEDAVLIGKILAHLDAKAGEAQAALAGRTGAPDSHRSCRGPSTRRLSGLYFNGGVNLASDDFEAKAMEVLGLTAYYEHCCNKQ